MQTVNLLTKIGTSRTNSNISKQWNWNQFKLQWAGKSRCDGDSWKENNSGILAWIPEISQIFRRYGGIWKQPQFPSPSGACSTETPGMGFGVNWFQSEPGALSPTALRAWWWKSLVLEFSWHIPEPENRERELRELGELSNSKPGQYSQEYLGGNISEFLILFLTESNPKFLSGDSNIT